MLLDEAAAGLPGTAFVFVTLDQQGRQSLDAFEAAVAKHPEILECYLLAGTADYLLRVVFADTADFERIHRGALTSLPGVVRVQSTLRAAHGEADDGAAGVKAQPCRDLRRWRCVARHNRRLLHGVR